MDHWQKLEVLSKVAAALLIPLALAKGANDLSQSNKQRDIEAKFVELSTSILSKEPGPNQSPESKSLRKWAVDVINKFSGVPLSAQAEQSLIEREALPVPTQAAAPSPPPVADTTWGLVFGGDTTLAAATQEITVTAKKMGLQDAAVFRRSGSFRSVKVINSRAEAEDALGRAQAVRASSYLVNMAKWCPTSQQQNGYYECSGL
ncbi:MAG: hypothetical protein RLZZ352_244 [Pseudomonadota bacterium]|jgi:hypothetical protein